MKNLLFVSALSCVALASCQSAEKPKNLPKSPPVSLNSSVEVVPGQTESEGDRRISQAIRQAVISNTSLSMAAKNVVIATNSGIVHLRGRVNSETEKQEIARLARSVAGVRQVENQLEVSKSQQ